MGSVLSGRRNGKPLVEDCLTLDLARLMQSGSIRDGQAGSGFFVWRCDGNPIGTARVRVDLRNGGVPRLAVKVSLGKGAPFTQTIALAATSQNFGGRRWWMRCPVTGKRARTLHLPPGADRFASRDALRLAYCVERFDHFDRPFEKLFRAQRKLGGPQGLAMALERPKGMWRSTFARHTLRLEALELGCATEIAALIDGS